MELNVRTIPNSKTILIPVASENAQGIDLSKVKTIKCKGKIYQVFDCYVYEKDEIPQTALMKLATGIDLEPAKIWKKYPNSETIFLFVCDSIEVKKEIKKVEAKPSMY